MNLFKCKSIFYFLIIDRVLSQKATQFCDDNEPETCKEVACYKVKNFMEYDFVAIERDLFEDIGVDEVCNMKVGVIPYDHYKKPIVIINRVLDSCGSCDPDQIDFIYHSHKKYFTDGSSKISWVLINEHGKIHKDFTRNTKDKDIIMTCYKTGQISCDLELNKEGEFSIALKVKDQDNKPSISKESSNIDASVSKEKSDNDHKKDKFKELLDEHDNLKLNSKNENIDHDNYKYLNQGIKDKENSASQENNNKINDNVEQASNKVSNIEEYLMENTGNDKEQFDHPFDSREMIVDVTGYEFQSSSNSILISSAFIIGLGISLGISKIRKSRKI